MKYLSIVVFLFVTLSCGNNTPESYTEEYPIEQAFETAYENDVESTAKEAVSRKLIKEGTIAFETQSIPETRKQVLAAIKKYNAYISSDQEYNYTDRKSNALVIRVPAADFDNLLNSATAGVSQFDTKEIKVKDVTEEFLDVETRIANKKKLETRYLELLTKANSVTEMLEVEKQIGELRADIEAMEGRLNYLKNKVSFATIHLTFYKTLATETAFGSKFKNGFKNGWENFIWFFVVLTNIWPFILILILLLVGLRWYLKRKKKEKK
ncbi:DUF4349 domain-containing protein [Aquimarina brevivitae]|nr:DUF4349 domain-containing protein [Aquimarina brevivitae]